MGLKYLPIMVAKVTETGLGTDGRSIKAANEIMPGVGEIPPLLDGLAKLPPPLVDDFVLIFTADAGNLYRWYMPIRQPLPSISQDGANIQIESEGKIQFQATDLIEIGQTALEPAVKGDQLKTQLEAILDQLAAETHTGNIGLPTSPPLNAAAYAAIKAALSVILSQKVKVE